MALVRLLRLSLRPLPRLAFSAPPSPALPLMTSQRQLWRSLFTARPLLRAAEKVPKTKLAPRELRRLLALAKPERWKLGGGFRALLSRKFGDLLSYLLHFSPHGLLMVMNEYHGVSFCVHNKSHSRQNSSCLPWQKGLEGGCLAE